MPRLDRRSAALASLVAAAFLLRYHESSVVLPLDNEYLQFWMALHPRNVLDFLANIRFVFNHLVIDPALAYAVGRFSPTLAAFRLPACLCGTAAVLGLWRLDDSGGPRAWLAAALLALSIPHIEWSRRADLWSLLSLLAVLHARAFLDLDFRARRKPWGYVLLTVVFFYAHPYCIVQLGIEALCLALFAGRDRRQALRHHLVWSAAAGVLFVPWFAYSTRIAYVQQTSILNMARAATAAEFAARLPISLAQATDVPPGLWSWDLGASSWLAAAYLVCYASSLLSRKKDVPMRLVHIAIPCSIASLFALNGAYHFYFNQKMLLWTLPFYLLAVADGAVFLYKGAARAWGRLAPAVATTAGAAAVIGGFLPAYARMTALEAGPGRGLLDIVRQVAEHARPGDRLVFDNGNLAQDILFHLDVEAFRGVERFREIQDGTPARGLPIEIDPAGRTPEDGRTWLLRGQVYSLEVRPPLR